MLISPFLGDYSSPNTGNRSRLSKSQANHGLHADQRLDRVNSAAARSSLVLGPRLKTVERPSFAPLRHPGDGARRPASLPLLWPPRGSAAWWRWVRVYGIARRRALTTRIPRTTFRPLNRADGISANMPRILAENLAIFAQPDFPPIIPPIIKRRSALSGFR